MGLEEVNRVPVRGVLVDLHYLSNDQPDFQDGPVRYLDGGLSFLAFDLEIHVLPLDDLSIGHLHRSHLKLSIMELTANEISIAIENEIKRMERAERSLLEEVLDHLLDLFERTTLRDALDVDDHLGPHPEVVAHHAVAPEAALVVIAAESDAFLGGSSLEELEFLGIVSADLEAILRSHRY